MNTSGADYKRGTDVCCISLTDHVDPRCSVNVLTVPILAQCKIFNLIALLTHTPYGNNTRVPKLWTASTTAHPSLAHNKQNGHDGTVCNETTSLLPL
jgi:hypothetical protein